jgi:hypothetical protein
MNTLDPTTIPDEVMAEMEAAADRAAKGIRDVEQMRRARQSMDHIRESERNTASSTSACLPFANSVTHEVCLRFRGIGLYRPCMSFPSTTIEGRTFSAMSS